MSFNNMKGEEGGEEKVTLFHFPIKNESLKMLMQFNMFPKFRCYYILNNFESISF